LPDGFFRSVASQDNLSSKTKLLLAAVAREVESKLSGALQTDRPA